jgi:hypothetical protein
MELLSFSHGDVQRHARPINSTDLAAARAVLHHERGPIFAAELMDYIFSIEGQVLLLLRCVQHCDETFTREDAEAMVFADDPFVRELYTRSGLI